MIRGVGGRKKDRTKPDDVGRDDIAGGDGRTGGGAGTLSPVFGAELETPDPLSPLDVMLHAMRSKWRQGDHDGAACLARVAAPYVHPKASAGRDEGLSPIQGLSDAELNLIVGGSKAGRGGSRTEGQARSQGVTEEVGD